mmetsp:Transcript_111776/g.193987  ORF Transcript_111776/g.193987 Transcript_111776/m.193987 type:complete len:204 (+) Transcript_111776:1080-1691(+)
MLPCGWALPALPCASSCALFGPPPSGSMLTWWAACLPLCLWCAGCALGLMSPPSLRQPVEPAPPACSARLPHTTQRSSLTQCALLLRRRISSASTSFTMPSPPSSSRRLMLTASSQITYLHLLMPHPKSTALLCVPTLVLRFLKYSILIPWNGVSLWSMSTRGVHVTKPASGSATLFLLGTTCLFKANRISWSKFWPRRSIPL